MFLCDPRTIHTKSKGGPCHPPVAGCRGGKELLHPRWAWGSKPSLSWAKQGNQKSQREECVEGDGKQKGEDTWNSGDLGIQSLEFFVLRLHWGLNSPSSPECFLLAAPEKNNLLLATLRLSRVGPRGYESLAPGRVVDKLPIQTWASGPLITEGQNPSVEIWMNSRNARGHSDLNPPVWPHS